MIVAPPCRMLSFLLPGVVLGLGGCFHTSPAANPARTAPPPRQGATIVLGSMDIMGPNTVRDVGAARRQALRGQMPDIEKYLTAVEAAMRALPAPNPTHDLIAKDWKTELGRGAPYHATLWWHKKDAPYYTIGCNIVSFNQNSTTEIFPDISIGKPRRDLRIDWFIHTPEGRDRETLKQIVLREAYKF